MGQPETKSTSRGLIIVCVVVAIIIALLVLAPGRKNRDARISPHITRIKQTGRVCLTYAADFDDILPPAEEWMTATKSYRSSDELLHDSLADPTITYGFAFYAPIGGQNASLYLTPHEIPMIFQTEEDVLNASGDLRWLPSAPRSPNGKDLYAHADGSAQFRDRTWARTRPDLSVKP